MTSEPITVWQVTEYISQRLKNDHILKRLYVRGEVSNVAVRGGHAYFSLKDALAVIKCVCFGVSYDIRSVLKEGAEVIVTGSLDVYKRGGTYNINVQDVMPVGQGALFAKLECLKQKLEAEGVFSVERKRRLPFIPERVGVITSPVGAAIKDIIKVAKERYAPAEVIVYPAKVQGDSAAREVCAGIRYFNRTCSVDVIIIARGGGSMEELFAFNDEELVRAVADSAIPTVSGVGHESDVTLTDLAADVRAATPSNAAELVFPDSAGLRAGVRRYLEIIDDSMRAGIEMARMEAESCRMALALHSPAHRLMSFKNETKTLMTQAKNAVSSSLAAVRAEYAAAREKLLSCDVIAILNRGFASVTKDGSRVRSAGELSNGDRLRLTFADGAAEAAVIRTELHGVHNNRRQTEDNAL